MKQKIERILKTASMAGIVILLLSSLAAAETNRQKVVKEACYALDGGIDYSCGSMTSTKGNWNYLTDFNKQKNSHLLVVFV